MAMTETTHLRADYAAGLALLACLAPLAAAAQPIQNGPLPQPLPLFPADNWWNVDVSGAPEDLNSANFIAFIGGGTPLHPDFGGDVDPGDPGNPETYGFPYASVPGSQPRVPVAFVEFGSQSDAGVPGGPLGYPIPEAAKTQAKWIEGGHPGNVDPGGDRHMLIVDRDNRVLYELYHTFWNAALNRWEAGSGAIFSLDGSNRRPETWTSADAAGLAIFPGLMRYDEAFGSDPIRHALRFTVDFTRQHVFPGSHTASTSSNVNALPIGARVRLKPLVNPVIPGDATPEEAAAVGRIVQAMKTYGMIVADNGSDMYFQGTYDTRWNNDVLNPAFASLHASDFEVIQLGWRPPVATIAPDLDFHTLTPCRVLDTRDPAGPFAGPSLFPGWHRAIPMGGRCGIPATAKAVSVNVTVTGATTAGHLVFFPADTYPIQGVQALPGANTISFGANQTRANNAVLKLAPNANLAVHNSAAGRVHLIVDVNGYFQ